MENALKSTHFMRLICGFAQYKLGVILVTQFLLAAYVDGS